MCAFVAATLRRRLSVQLTSAGGVTYAYDGDGRRVEKSNGKLYWYGSGSAPLDETNLAGNPNNSSFFEYISFGGARPVTSSNGNTYKFTGANVT